MLECIHQGCSSQAWWPDRQTSIAELEAVPPLNLLYSMSGGRRRVACPFANRRKGFNTKLNRMNCSYVARLVRQHRVKMRAPSGRCAGNSGKEKEIQMPITMRYRP